GRAQETSSMLTFRADTRLRFAMLRFLPLWLALVAALVWSQPLAAQDPLRERTSLGLVPDDAAFYSTSLRLKEQFDAFVGSKAFAKLVALPFMQDAVREFHKAFAEHASDESLKEFFDFWKDPENQQLLGLLKEMISSEVFFYGDHSVVEFAVMMQELG